ncbi:MAG: hypothetical protein JXR10_16230 [Cyclobacteriaceae bacterium]
MFFKKSNKELVEVLNETHELLVKYDNISWEGLSPAEASMDLEIAIDQISKGKTIHKQHLITLFLPTGLIQECAIANNWNDKYLVLSDRFDALINNL